MGVWWNCGVFALAHAETYLHAAPAPASLDPLQLRLRYFKLLTDPTVPPQDDPVNNQRPSKKRQGTEQGPFSKRLRISAQIPTDYGREERIEIDEGKLRAFGEAWAKFYRDRLEEYKPEDVYRGLVLASIPACGPVMAQLADLLKDHSVDRMPTEYSMSIQLFIEGATSSAHGELLQRVSGTEVYRDFHRLKSYHHERLKAAHKVRRAKRKSRNSNTEDNPHRTASAYAIDYLLYKHIKVAEHGRTSTGDRALIKNAKEKGEAMHRVNDLLLLKSTQENRVNDLLLLESTQEPGCECLQYLLPLQKMPSPLDQDAYIACDEYVSYFVSCDSSDGLIVF